ncbi:hypothetical protein [Kitasatospora sp. NBC_01302]|uniref:hypothetical protein n=1 Tax=Kitasatospora sp. NBC_01302 TaxID=2903575 RepID=UPI002E135B9A|nr:hypothetical protein OG294_39680 [Kitasatospora sp. NBC_01302]
MSQAEAEARTETASAPDDLVRKYAVDQLVRCLQERRPVPGEDAGWWRRHRHERSLRRLRRATDRAFRFEGAVDEAFLRYLKIELAIHVLTARTADQATMWQRTEGILSARTLVELRDFVRRSSGRPDWDFTTDRQRPTPPQSDA